MLGMLRLGVWQLDRAEQKREILQQQQAQAQLPETSLSALVAGISAEQRFRKVYASGQYLPEQTIFLDNQVYNSKVGYHVLTPFQLFQSDVLLLVNRGWVPVGASRATLPLLETPHTTVKISGRLNLPAAQPPLWSDEYPVSQGRVWQFLPLQQYAQEIGLHPLPLVLELAPAQPGTAQLFQHWQKIDDEWVAKHQAYAFQWFAMALVFLVACIAVWFKSLSDSRKQDFSNE